MFVGFGRGAGGGIEWGNSKEVAGAGGTVTWVLGWIGVGGKMVGCFSVEVRAGAGCWMWGAAALVHFFVYPNALAAVLLLARYELCIYEWLGYGVEYDDYT